MLKQPVRFSNLKHMQRSPAHYRYRLENPLEQSRAMRIGSAVHTKLLGGDIYAVWNGKRRGKAWLEFAASQGGAMILSGSEENEVAAIVASFKDNRDAMQIIERCQREVRVPWSWCGRECSSTVDLFDPNSVTELKVAHTADPQHFWRHCTSQLWHAQLAFYRLALGNPERTARVIAVECKPPYPTTVYRIAESDLINGEKLCRTWMERLLQCEAEDHWPGYAEREVELTPPEWSMAAGDGMDEDEAIVG